MILSSGALKSASKVKGKVKHKWSPQNPMNDIKKIYFFVSIRATRTPAEMSQSFDMINSSLRIWVIMKYRASIYGNPISVWFNNLLMKNNKHSRIIAG